MKKIPSIDIGCCNGCLGCIDVAPEVFRLNEVTGLVEVNGDLSKYTVERVDEAIKNCPRDCIDWDEE